VLKAADLASPLLCDELAGLDKVGAVPGVAFAEQDGAGAEFERLQPGREPVGRDRRQPAEERIGADQPQVLGPGLTGVLLRAQEPSRALAASNPAPATISAALEPESPTTAAVTADDALVLIR
jgi:hypothetical protein